MTAPSAGPRGERLAVAIVDDTAYIHVVGRGSFKVGSGMKQFGVASIGQGCRQIVLDMAECTGMDSTFMGVVAGLAFRLKQQGEGSIFMVNLSERTRGLLATLGLDQVVETHMEGETPAAFRGVLGAGYDTEAIEAVPASRAGTARTMLEAHENLVSLSPDNLPKFKDVLSYLREDLHAGEAADDTPP